MQGAGPAERRRCGGVALAVSLLLALAHAPAAPAAGPDPAEGAGGPILLVTDPADAFGRYYAEILRAEGLTAFSVAEIGTMDAELLARHDAVVLAARDASAGQAAMLDEWVRSGGNLVAMRPGPSLSALLGLGADAGDLAEGYVGVDTSRPPGAGITSVTLQVHGTADVWSGATARTVARLFSGATTPTAAPAVTLRSVGSEGGQAAAFT